MSIFDNEAVFQAMLTGEYICSQCGALMEFEDKWEDILICLECNHSLETERYGFENDEDYDALFPTEAMVLNLPNEEDDDLDCDGEYDNDEEYGRA